MAEGCLADDGRIEPGTFQKDIPGGSADPGMKSAEDAAHGNSAIRITDHQVLCGQFSLLPIQGHESGSFRQVPNDDLPAFDGVQVKSMKGLSQFMQDEIGNIDDIADRPDP